MDLVAIIDRMAEIKLEKDRLDDEYSKLQAKLQVTGETALEDTKYKSVSYSGTSSKATITLADKVSNVLPSLFVDIFGKAYTDLVNVTQKVELTADGKRLVAAIWNREYCEGSVEDLVNGLSCDDKAKKSLIKKLNGKNFETDKKNLMKIGGLSEEAASDSAYLVAEITAWNKIQSIIKLNNSGSFLQTEFEEFVLKVNAAVCVEQSTKVAVSSLDE